MGVVSMVLGTGREVKQGGKSWLKGRNKFLMEIM